jgi:4-alpha-glucanotransferase
LPLGYHRLRLEAAGTAGEALLVSAPRRCFQLEAGEQAERGDADLFREASSEESSERTVWAEALERLRGTRWGIFAPVYALRSDRDWGAGDLVDLGVLMDWTGEHGGSVVATLPLLAISLDEREAGFSPYRPLTRLFWNEFYLSPERIEEWARCPAAAALCEDPERRKEHAALKASESVDYAAVMALKRPVLEELSRCFWDTAGDRRRKDFEGYMRQNRLAADYALFRAAMEGTEGCSAQEVARYHLFCQWQMSRQLGELSAKERSGGFGGRPGLMLDLPVGVHPEGFDVARWPGLFAIGASTGAPPDAFFADGQDWKTPPFHPETDRRGGYEYFRACLRNHMQFASVVRVDHVMSFHRLFWLPAGTSPRDGVYVTYPAEELYAVLALESHRHRTAVVGEDLGTVPAGVRASMRLHGVARTWVLLGSLRFRSSRLGPRAALADVPAGAVATLGTHDMVPLAGFLHGDDIAIRAETRQLDPAGARREAAKRRHLVAGLAEWFGVPADDLHKAAGPILWACLAVMARSAAGLVVVNLEDLFLERRPQNVPGTGGERANWRRKVAVSLQELAGRERRVG